MEITLPNSHLTQSRTVVLQHGEVLACTDDLPKGIYTVLSGKLKRRRPYPSGDYLVGIAKVGDRLGLAEALLGRTNPETWEAIGRVEVQIEPRSNFDMRMRSLSPEMRRSFEIAAVSASSARHFGDALLVSSGSASRLRRPLDLLPVRSRVAATLWILKSVYGETTPRGFIIDLNLTREEIAHLASTVYESVIRALTKLKKDGLIQLEGRKIWILDEVQLARVAQVVVEQGDYDKEAITQVYSPKDNCRSQEAS